MGSQSSEFQSLSPQRSVVSHQHDVAPGNMTGLQSPGFQSASPQRSVLYPEKDDASPRKVLGFQSPSPGSTSKQAPNQHADPPRLAAQTQNFNVGLPQSNASIAVPAAVPPKTPGNNYVPRIQISPQVIFSSRSVNRF